MTKPILARFLHKQFPVLFVFKYRILNSIHKHRNIAKDVYIDPSVHVLGWRAVRIGFGTVISEATWLNVNQGNSDRPQIVIEENCFIGRRNFLSSGSLIRLGAYCLTGPDCKFLGSDHVISDPFQPYATTGATTTSTIDIGVNCWIGAGAVILGSVKIGHGSIIGVNTLVNSDVPPFSLVVGNPGRIIKRFKLTSNSWVSTADAMPADLLVLPCESEYLSILRKAHPEITLPIYASGKRMGDLP